MLEPVKVDGIGLVINTTSATKWARMSTAYT